MKLLRSKRGIVTAGILLLLLLFLVRPGANRLRTRIVNSISLALGRPEEVASVKFRLLPQPGFDLEDFVVQDNPAFGAEPMLRCGEVTASLRVAPLLRGRLEVVRLSLSEPSLNLVRSREGHWNVENLLERTEKMAVAPTAKASTERRPAFPYIEAGRGRINFKFGLEKKPYALTEADFAFWQDSENGWSMRLSARPMRTDFNLSDTGLLRVHGSWQRAVTLRDTPLNFTVLWEGAQLGQLSKLVYGSDQGWRGTAEISASLAGTPANLAVQAEASAEDFRRYNVLGGGAMRLAAQCGGRYSSVGSSLSDIACRAPVGEGTVRVSGSAASLLESPSYDLALIAEGVPIQAVVNLLRHARSGLPEDLLASGQLDAKLNFRRGAGRTTGVIWEGVGEASGLRLVSEVAGPELTLNSVPFAVVSSAPPNSRATLRHPTAGDSTRRVPDSRVDIGPFHVNLGRPAPVLAHGWVSPAGYDFVLQGESQVGRLLQAARLFGVPVLQTSAEGTARIDLQLSGDWSGAFSRRATGSAQLRSVQAKARGWNAPLQITSANLTLTPDRTLVQNLNASVAGTAWHGSLSLPRPCTGAEACVVSFDLHADEIAIDRLNQWLSPNARPQPWYRFLSSGTDNAYLLSVNAVGKLTANRLVIGRLVQNHLSTTAELKGGVLRLSDLQADVLGGKHKGEWKADFTSKPPQYSGSGTLQGASLEQLAEVMNDSWITGSATATYRGSASGLTLAELLNSASATLQVQAQGVLPHILLTEKNSPLQMRELTARLILHNAKFEIEDGKLLAADAIYQVSGTASLARILSLKLTRDGAPGFDITGTLSAPRVAPAATPETRAALKARD